MSEPDRPLSHEEIEPLFDEAAAEVRQMNPEERKAFEEQIRRNIPGIDKIHADLDAVFGLPSIDSTERPHEVSTSEVRSLDCATQSQGVDAGGGDPMSEKWRLRFERIEQLRAKRREQIKAVNQDPLNQAALRHLKTVGEADDHDSGIMLHIFALMLWGLEEGGLKITPHAPEYVDHDKVLMYLVDLIDLDSDPEAALAWFKNSDHPEDEDNEVCIRPWQLDAAESPEAAAGLLIETLYNKIVESRLSARSSRSFHRFARRHSQGGTGLASDHKPCFSARASFSARSYNC